MEYLGYKRGHPVKAILFFLMALLSYLLYSEESVQVNTIKDSDRRSKNYPKHRLQQEAIVIKNMSHDEIIKKIDAIKITDDIQVDNEESYFIEALLLESMDKENENMIKYILLNKPPEGVGLGYLELFLAYKKDGKYFNLLFSCYNESKMNYAKHIILESLRRAFPNIIEKGNAEFVIKVEEYYKKNKPHLTVNIKNYYPCSGPDVSEVPLLFIEKENSTILPAPDDKAK